MHQEQNGGQHADEECDCYARGPVDERVGIDDGGNNWAYRDAAKRQS